MSSFLNYYYFVYYYYVVRCHYKDSNVNSLIINRSWLPQPRPPITTCLTIEILHLPYINTSYNL